MSGGLVGRVDQLLELAGKATPRPWTSEHPGIVLVESSDDEFLVAAVNLVEPLARDWQRMRQVLTETEVELNAHGLSHHMGDEECIAGYVLGRIREVLVSVSSGEPDK